MYLERNRKEVYQYINDIESGRIPSCQKVKQLIQRYKRDIQRTGEENCNFYFDEERANRVIEFCEELVHVKGEHARYKQKVRLQPWQKFYIWYLYGFIIKGDFARRFRKAYTQLAKKTGKSFLASALGLYHFIADGEPGAEVYTVGPESGTARITYDTMRSIINRTELSDIVKKNNKYRIEYNDNIIMALTGDPDSNDGKNPSFAIIDEYHLHKTDGMLQSMQQGMISRKQPLLFVITTAGTNLYSPCHREEYQYASEILSGEKENDEYFACIYEMDKDDDYRNINNFIKCCPNYGITIYEDAVLQQIKTAKDIPTKEGIILTKTFNRWVNASTRFLPHDVWLSNKGQHSIEDFIGETAYIGIDLSRMHDLTCVSFMFEKEGVHYGIEKYFLPKENIDSKSELDGVPYRHWKDEGYLILTDGPVINYRDIFTFIVEMSKIIDIRAVQYDGWNSSELITWLDDAGFNCYMKGQKKLSLNAPIKNWYYEILKSNFRYSNPITDWCAANVEAEEDNNNNIKLIKPRSGDAKARKKIDGIIATIMAYDLWYSMKEERVITLGNLISSDDDLEDVDDLKKET